jgi:multiple sugar transport system ATP-binding protein
VPAPVARQLEGYAEREVILGVRPELLSDRQHARFETNGNSIDMVVRQVQMLGDSLHVYLSTSKHPKLVASVDGYAQFKAKDVVPIYVDMQRALFFSADDAGTRLNVPASQ